jgi:hypothetical protein
LIDARIGTNFIFEETFKVSKILKGALDRRVEREEEKQGIAGLGT